MNTVDLVQKKVAGLPEEIQLQVLDFVNFLATQFKTTLKNINRVQGS